MKFKILVFLSKYLDKLLSNYCCICGKRLVRYPDGYMDCPDIVKSEKQRRGVIVP